MKQILNKSEIINSTYKVQFFIGGDTFCEKYRVKGKDGTIYLLKLYNSSKLSKNDFLNQNLLEVDILASLNLDNSIKLVNNGEYVKDNKKYHYIVLDFISGETLQDKLGREGIFSQYSAVPTIIYLLEALQKIHKKSISIIHNNINPNSIHLDSLNADKPILAEFGFARYITSKSNSLDLSRLSPFYIAPELYNGIFTPQSDIFSVGALLYNLIMGIPPWFIEIPNYQHTQEKFIDAINEKRKETLNFWTKGFEELEDKHLKRVIKKALAIDIDDRFKNADEFISALKREIDIIDDSYIQSTHDSCTVKLTDERGMYWINISIGGTSRKFMLDSGASDVLISKEFENKLFEKSILKKEHYRPNGYYKIADGSIIECTRLLIPELKIGEFTLKNITTVVNLSDTMLLGKSVLDKFKSWNINNRDKTIELNK